jgi:hypothetical protein
MAEKGFLGRHWIISGRTRYKAWRFTRHRISPSGRKLDVRINLNIVN